ncbi:MAG: hypothetical protein ACFFCW_00450, partial [Candidatus Hodarchaeota archaeon]
KLATAGAQAVLSEYDNDGILCAMSFRIQGLYFRLPLNIEGVYQALKRDRNVPKRLKTYEQAARVAWRIVKDWIEAQIAIIEAGQAELQQVFLPYAQNNEGKTLYEIVKDGGFKLLAHDN